jgi:hypothetical protein
LIYGTGNPIQNRKGMNTETIREFCLAFPQATENLQWGDDLCFKIGGKIFAIIGLDNPRLCFKCTPEIFGELIEREDVRPAALRRALQVGDAGPVGCGGVGRAAGVDPSVV